MNNILPFIFLGVLVLAAATVLVAAFLRLRKRKLSAPARKRVMEAWNHVGGITDPTRKILEADKVLDLALKELGYTGTLADKLKAAGPRFSDVNAVWRAHKLRNHLAHEPGAHANSAEVSGALRAFERAINDLS